MHYFVHNASAIVVILANNFSQNTLKTRRTNSSCIIECPKIHASYILEQNRHAHNELTSSKLAPATSVPATTSDSAPAMSYIPCATVARDGCACALELAVMMILALDGLL